MLFRSTGRRSKKAVFSAWNCLIMCFPNFFWRALPGKTFWINALKGNTHLREWTFENFQKRQIRSFSRVRSLDLDCPLSNIIPKKKETKYHLRNKRAHHPEIKTDRFKNVFVNRLIFLDTIFDLSNICIQYVIRLFRLSTADVT